MTPTTEVNEICNITRDLISFKTTQDNKKEIEKCFEYIKTYFSDTTFEIKEFDFDGHKSIFVFKKSGKFDCLFSGHIDVVPAEDKMFDATIKDGAIFGRGSFDMKGQVATIMHLLKHDTSNKNIAALFTSDEEIGGFFGTGKVVESMNVCAEVAIVPDGGKNFEVVCGQRGVLQLDITCHGKSVHSSVSRDGVNAVLKCCEVFDKIEEILNKFGKSTFTINLASINTENTAFNKVPDIANMQIDIRYESTCKLEEVFLYLQNNENLQYKIYAQASPFFVDVDNDFVKKYIAICKEILNRDVIITKCNSASDARFFSERNIPAIISNPDGEDMHGKNENIKISSVEKMLKIYKTFITQL